MSEDINLYFDKIDIEELSKQYRLTKDASFIIPNEKLSTLIAITLVAKIMYKEKRGDRSTFFINRKKGVATLKMTRQDFDSWFISPSSLVKDLGPIIRMIPKGSVYISFEEYKNSKLSKETIMNSLTLAGI